MVADGKAATALVTNTGVIVADGGTVQLTARAADGIVQNLVQAGGTIRAATISDRTGIVALDGVGGSIVVEGRLTAPGSAPGTIGGDIQVVTNGNVTLASTAKVNVAGKSGGGAVAIGTVLARAKGGPSVSATQTATNVTIQQGATIAADARANGNGGRVAVLSTGTTLMSGSISAKGGPQGGNGGWVETSGGMLGVGNNAVVDVGAQAPSGQPGTWLLDPFDITITTIDQNTSSSGGTFTGSADPATVANTTVQTALGTGNVIISTAGRGTGDNGNITVSAPVTWTSSNSLTLLADGNLTVNSPIVGGGNVALEAGQSRQSVLTINATVQSGGLIYLTDGSGPTSGDGILINAPVGSTRPQAQQGPLITVACDCFMNNGAGGSLDAVNGTVEFGPLSAGQQFKIGGIESFINANLFRFGQTHDPLTGAPGKTAGSLTMGDGALDFHHMNLELDTSDTIVQTFGSSMVNVANLSGKAVNSAILDSSSNSIVSFGSFTVSNGSLLLKDSAPLTVSGPVAAGADIILVSAGPLTISSDLTAHPKTGSLDLVAGATMTQTTGSITGNKLTGSASSAAFTSSLNQINNLGPFATSSGFSLSDSVPLTVVGAVSTGSGGSIALRMDSLTISAPVTAQNGTVAIAPLTTARGMSLDFTSSGTTLSLLQSDLNQINAGTVALGSLDGGANLLAASFTVNSPMTFNGIAGILGLFASGSISEVGAGALTVATLTGKTGINALLAGSNSINALGNFVAASGFALTDAPGLTVNAGSAVNGGTNVTITDSGLLTITGSVLGTTVDLTGSNIDIPGSVDGPSSVSLKATPGGINETGSLATGLLTGSAATSATLSGATPTANLISNLGPFTDTSGGFSLATAGPLTVAGAVTTKGNVSLQATGDLSISNPVVAADSNIVMQAGHNLTISTPLSASGILYLKANTANDPADPGNFMINAPVSGGIVYLASTSNLGITIDQLVTSTGASPLITVACDCLIKSDPPLPQVLLQAPGGTIEYRSRHRRLQPDDRDARRERLQGGTVAIRIVTRPHQRHAGARRHAHGG